MTKRYIYLILFLFSVGVIQGQPSLKTIINSLNKRIPKEDMRPNYKIPSSEKKEDIFTNLKITTDIDGTVYLNDSPFVLKSGGILNLSIPQSYSIFFVTEDKKYETETINEKLRADKKNVIQVIEFQLAEKYAEYIRTLKQQEQDTVILTSIKEGFVTINDKSKDYLHFGIINFGKYEVTLAQYALYKRNAKQKISSRADKSSIVDISRKLELKRTTKLGIDWQHDAIGRKIDDIENSTLPVVNVSWQEAVAFCEWMSTQDLSYNYRLPNLREWLYFAKCGMYDNPYPWGKEKDGYIATANLRDNSLKKVINAVQSNYMNYEDGFAFISPVGSFDPNCYGIYDLGGNVAEWLEDQYANYNSATETKIRRLFVGGSYYTTASACDLHQLGQKIKKEQALPEDVRNSGIGFRMIKEPK